MITKESEIVGHISDVQLHDLAVEAEDFLAFLERGCGHFNFINNQLTI